MRHCDGYFFPLSYSERDGSASLADFCKASCPDAEVSVYTRVPGEAIETAVGLDGSPIQICRRRSNIRSHSTRPAPAGRPARPGRILWRTRNASSTMAAAATRWSRQPIRPRWRGRKPIRAPKRCRSKPCLTTSRQPTRRPPRRCQPRAPDSAGIATGDVKNGTAYSQGQGQTVEATGPDGVKRRVRIVGPQL